ncbi:MAG: toprim domain-containing protein [Bacteroidota bacterium]|nr:toprim domain-containing protein [Bacteroidota bacterium]
MNFSKQRFSLEEIKQISLVNYLSKLGHQPAKIRNFDYWYLSPLREEKTPSFKVNDKLNRWYDHGLGRGGNVIDFAIEYHNWTIGEALQQLRNGFSFHQPLQKSSQQQKESVESKIKIIKEAPLSSFSLFRYLHQRRIPIEIAERFCKEIKYELNGKEFFGIGFKNDSGGYEIRNPYFKGSSSPKDITTFNNGAKEAAVFEGFMDLLSFMVMRQTQPENSPDLVILNSVSFFEKARQFMEEHDDIRLYLDHDTIGQSYSQYALSISDKYKDESHLYKLHKDLNDWLVNIGKAHKKNLEHKHGKKI